MTVAPQGFPDLVLVSTQATSGPAQFVVHKSYQITTTVVCDPPDEVHIVERRDLFRVPVATPVTLTTPSGQHAAYSMDISTGGVRVCSPEPFQVGAEVDLSIDLGGDQVVVSAGVVRHSEAFAGTGSAQAPPRPGGHDVCPSQVGFQFTHLTSRAERQLAQFVARHQRRLMPRVKTFLTAQYSCERRPLFVDAPVTEVSPGEIVLVAREAHLPGEPLGLRLRVGGRAYSFGARVVSYKSELMDDGERIRHLVVASLPEGEDIAEERFRIAVRDLALEQWPPEVGRPASQL
jgi:c-di-GMP-binding flagellar brake protein YcgR